MLRVHETIKLRLNAVWKLPLEQQHDVLLGTRELLHGNCAGVNSTGRVWHFLATEVRDRGVELPSFSSIPPMSGGSLRGPRGGRPRSRSPSI
ncbi:unnamed protein product [Durusdinium trenchii]|uniref:Uncharacterized protein n=1 Tax=Durusdinium trenchii TaxID=1381693 RepID=A0ABP0MIT6_9DINO